MQTFFKDYLNLLQEGHDEILEALEAFHQPLSIGLQVLI